MTLPPRMRLAAALILPFASLACIWWTTHHLAQKGQDWLVPVRGYDPRDLLRGHYIQYRYEWPLAAPSGNSRNAPFDPAFAPRLCIEGRAPDIAQVRDASMMDADAARGCAIVVHAAIGARQEVRGLDSGILFLSQTRAVSLERQLADPHQQGFVRVRIRPDGVMRPIDMEFRPRPARTPTDS